jgi:hypothetical protein
MATIFTAYIGFASERYSEEENRQAFREILNSADLNGYTLVDNVGLFDGLEEQGCQLIVIAPDGEENSYRETLVELLEDYKQEARQYAVWLTSRQEELTIL